ncbi:hypothetical protein OY671_007923, partial [Metschnikowia pulcherrima]
RCVRWRRPVGACRSGVSGAGSPQSARHRRHVRPAGAARTDGGAFRRASRAAFLGHADGALFAAGRQGPPSRLHRDRSVQPPSLARGDGHCDHQAGRAVGDVDADRLRLLPGASVSARAVPVRDGRAGDHRPAAVPRLRSLCAVARSRAGEPARRGVAFRRDADGARGLCARGSLSPLARVDGEGLLLRLHDLDPARRVRCRGAGGSVAGGPRSGADRRPDDRDDVHGRRADRHGGLSAYDEAAGCADPHGEPLSRRSALGVDSLPAVHPDRRWRRARLSRQRGGVGLSAAGSHHAIVDSGGGAGAADRGLCSGDRGVRPALFQPHSARRAHQWALRHHPPSRLCVQERLSVAGLAAVPDRKP